MFYLLRLLTLSLLLLSCDAQTNDALLCPDVSFMDEGVVVESSVAGEIALDDPAHAIPLSNVTVTLLGDGEVRDENISNDEGEYFVIKDSPCEDWGELTVSFSAPGYQPLEIPLVSQPRTIGLTPNIL